MRSWGGLLGGWLGGLVGELVGSRVCHVVAELLKARLVLGVCRIVKDARCGDSLDIAL